MSVYILQINSKDFQALRFVNDQSVVLKLHWFQGYPIGDEWPGFEVEPEFEEPDRPSSDFPFLCSGLTLLSHYALYSLYDDLEGKAEILPLQTSGDKYFVMNVTNILDALDEDRSRINRAANGQIITIKDYVFKQELIENEYIFKIPQLRVPIFITQKFVEKARAKNLSGLKPLLLT